MLKKLKMYLIHTFFGNQDKKKPQSVHSQKLSRLSKLISFRCKEEIIVWFLYVTDIVVPNNKPNGRALYTNKILE